VFSRGEGASTEGTELRTTVESKKKQVHMNNIRMENLVKGEHQVAGGGTREDGVNMGHEKRSGSKTHTGKAIIQGGRSWQLEKTG